MVKKITNNIFEILSLYLTNYSASIHIRAMAKLIGASHVALLPYLKTLEEPKILQTEIAGKNKQYTLNKNNLLTKYYLIVAEGSDNNNILAKDFHYKKTSRTPKQHKHLKPSYPLRQLRKRIR